MELNITTPGLLFSTLSLLLLAYTNRFLAISALIRSLHEKYKEAPEPVILKQIQNLRRRLLLIRDMQGAGVLSLILCVICIILLFYNQMTLAKIIFASALGFLLLSLIFSVREIHISIIALNLQLSEIEDYSRSEDPDYPLTKRLTKIWREPQA